MNKNIVKLFGNKSARDMKALWPYVSQINAEFEKLRTLSDDELRAQTRELKNIISAELAQLDNKLNTLKKKVEDNPEMDVSEKEDIFSQIDKLEKEHDVALEKTLMKILPRAFAVVKETARRFKDNGSLCVKATMHDKTIAAKKNNVVIEGEKAIWKNKWIAAGNEITWDMVHYDVQLIGGIVLHQGKIAEMATGEGKTLVATLPAYLNALGGKGVHIVTVNDYLAKRDCEWMGPLFEFHELTTDCIDKHEANSPQRRAAYYADITYGTNNEFGFDYLRDNMTRTPDELVQRKLHFAMVDEVDSVLIDDARTPLIIAGPVGKSDEQEFYDLKPRVHKLVEAQKKIVNEFLVQAKKYIAEKNEKEGGLALFRAYRGLPKSKPLIKYLSETGIKAILQKTENFYLQDNAKMMPEADAPLYFTIDEKNNTVELTDKGIEYITGETEDPNLFILPDLGTRMAEIEKDKSLSEEERLLKKDDLLKEYSIKAQRIHTIQQLLRAYTLFEKDVDYIIQNNRVMIVDEQTGRILEGRRYSDGLHQALEAKENVKVEEATQTYATITLQNYFRMYHKLAGMTGTAETEAAEFWDIYKLDVVVIPTNKPCVRIDMQDKVYKTTREKYNAVVEEIVELTKIGRPVLVGTTSVEISELLSRMLKIRNIKHQVLNAKLHQKEAEIVAEAGKPGTVTIATNMAGRGTDIKLTPESRAAGGLAILGTERHESRRVDRQLRGRSGRQGDPGSSQFFVSLEDNLMRLFGSDRIAKLMDRMGLKEGEVIQHSLITKSIERAQKKVEENNFAVRKRLLEYDNVMNSQREVIYKRRRNALYGERLHMDILNVIYDLCEGIFTNTQAKGNFDNFKLAVIKTFGFNTTISQDQFNRAKATELTQQLYSEAVRHYYEKTKALTEKTLPVLRDIFNTRGAVVENVVIPFTDQNKEVPVMVSLKKSIVANSLELRNALEKTVSLMFIDSSWKEHLRDMDDLKQQVHNAVFEQKDPLLVYKFEGFKLFQSFLAKVNQEIVSFLFKAELQTNHPDQVQEAKQTKAPREKLSLKKDEAHSVLSSNIGPARTTQPPKQEEKIMPIRSQKIANRNDRVSVRYTNGEIKRDVKFKTVEDDIKNNKCVIINP
ncbi:MAG: preprotein translocase subunit SecA [Cytophagaceae bacterium]|nr:preprotein translocase subunit SecA [Cytophagaceae bacterium]MDW8456604.1 preprotein translocase subunit SecA [Cytophagaceae bacterium]